MFVALYIAGVVALMAAVYAFGARPGRPQPLPTPAWKPGVAFRLHQENR